MQERDLWLAQQLAAVKLREAARTPHYLATPQARRPSLWRRLRLWLQQPQRRAGEQRWRAVIQAIESE